MIAFPLKIISLDNQRLHWAERMRLIESHRNITAYMLVMARKPKLPVVVTLTRVGKRRLDSDGVVSGFKGVRDEVAKWLGVDDADGTGVRWRYAQRKENVYAVEISFADDNEDEGAEQ